MGLLSAVLLLPLVTALAICFVPKDAHEAVRRMAAAATSGALLLTVYMFATFDVAAGGTQFVERVPWIHDLGVTYALGVDGISLPMLLLAEVIGVAAVFSSWRIEKQTKEFFVLLLTFMGGVTGTFIACDLFVFLLCCEVVVIPIYIMILVWGSTKRVPKDYAAMKLTMFLLMGSGFMLVGIVAVYLTAYPAGLRTFDMAALGAAARNGALSEGFQVMAFALVAMAFCSLISMVPLHNWSPDGHAAAPTTVSMVHAGLLKKIGAYGVIRVGLFILPLGVKFWAPVMATLAMINIVYAAYVALDQNDLKYIVGYSSVSHMGYILFGLSALNVVSVSGALANMVAHGMMTALFFSQIGYIYHLTHLRTVPELRGLAHHMPRLTIGFMLAGLTAVGLPGLVAFVPEFTIFLGAIKVYPVQAVIAISGTVLTALYVLRLLAKALFGEKAAHLAQYPDESGPDLVPLLVLGAFIIGFGLFPGLLMRVIECGMEPLVPILAGLATAPTLLGGVF